MSEWINIKDRLPNDDVDALIVVAGGDFILAWYKNKIFRKPNGVYILRDVTHWMPLPDPPK